MEYYVAIYRGWDCAIWDNMDGPTGYYAKWNKSDWERQMPWFHS